MKNETFSAIISPCARSNYGIIVNKEEGQEIYWQCGCIQYQGLDGNHNSAIFLIHTINIMKQWRCKYVFILACAIRNCSILYVFQHGEMTGCLRMVISVPAHALFGITMGYYLGLAKFYKKGRELNLIRSLLYPVVLHGIFDFILFLGNYKLLFVFIPFVVFLYIDGFRRMKDLSKRSVFRR